jgi:hypothetical protein
MKLESLLPEGWSKLRSEERHDFCLPPNITKVIRWWRMRQAGQGHLRVEGNEIGSVRTYSVTLCRVRVMVIRHCCPNCTLPFHWNLVAGNDEFLLLLN